MKHSLVIVTAMIVSLLTQTGHAINKQPGPALQGYDVVSYFTKSRAEKGNEIHVYSYNGSNYHFSSDKHRDLFIENPEKYLPQYDGYCAYGVTVGKKMEASPEAWIIVDGRLYLNLNKNFLARWSKDVSASISEGDDQWQLIREIPAEDL